MLSREDFALLGNAYIEDYRRTCGLDKLLRDYGIYVEEIGDGDLLMAIEQLLNGVSPHACTALLDIATCGNTLIYDESDKDGDYKPIDDLEELYNSLLNDNEFE